MSLTDMQIEALKVIDKHDGLKAREFARRFWDSPNGGKARAGQAGRAAVYLNTLRDKGMVHWSYSWLESDREPPTYILSDEAKNHLEKRGERGDEPTVPRDSS